MKAVYRNLVRTLLCAGLLLGAGVLLSAQEPTSPPDAPAADNTKVNERDRSKTAVTADQAKNSANDRDIMQKIRKAVVGDSSLSTYAHNVKIISQNGKVTLKGPVRSMAEKSKIQI